MKYLKLFESWNYDDLSDDELEEKLKYLEIEKKEIDNEISDLRKILIQKRDSKFNYRNSFYEEDGDKDIKVYRNFIDENLSTGYGILDIDFPDNEDEIIIKYEPDEFSNINYDKIKKILDDFVDYLGFDYTINGNRLSLTWDDRIVEIY
jgi:hypothetical protein